MSNRKFTHGISAQNRQSQKTSFSSGGKLGWRIQSIKRECHFAVEIYNKNCFSDVKDAPITVDSCSNTVIFLQGLTKNLIIDDCENVTILGFVADSTYIRNSKNCRLVLVTGQFRTRDCRQLNLYLHCPTQPVIESTTRVEVSPIRMDFVGVENIEMKHSKFNNQWQKVNLQFHAFMSSFRSMTLGQLVKHQIGKLSKTQRG